jgi:phage FluMu protein Com
MEKFKGNATYFERKSGSLEEIVSKINEANPKPEVFDLKKESEDYKAVFDAAMKKFKINSPADLKSDEEKKKFFDYVDSQYKAKGEQIDPKAKKVNQSQMSKDGEEETQVKKSVRETVQDMLLKSWKQAAEK